MEKNVNYYEVVSINEDKSGKVTNPLTGKEQEYITCDLAEVADKTTKGGRRVFNGTTIGFTFTEREHGGWIRLLNQYRKKELGIEELPVLEAYIHEQKTDPYYMYAKDKDGEFKIVEYPEGHEDEGKPAVANSFRQLLTVDQDPEKAVNAFLTSKRVKLIKTFTAQGGNVPEYKNSKANTILELGELDKDGGKAGEEKADG